MTTIPSESLGEGIARLIAQVGKSHEPVHIVDKDGTAVLISEEDWRAIQETLYLMSIPGMRESIREAMEEPLSEGSEDPGW
ncbi:MAG: type II toxin-antitoxin system Phd/YefM family antitoxin [Candidatus Hydrogenedentes bacterium]|nr:type II toxin-antitoxin system Phd/YefM family antitoxin [Candidatus Hydrogenedentota bacterium]